MAEILFDEDGFRTRFPSFADEVKYPGDQLQLYWNAAITYISNTENSWISGDILRRALELMTCHLIVISEKIQNGENSGYVIDATIDKVSVSKMPPPADSTWRWWISSTGYGTELAAMLKAHSAGGFYIGGLPERSGFRRVGGGFGGPSY